MQIQIYPAQTCQTATKVEAKLSCFLLVGIRCAHPAKPTEMGRDTRKHCIVSEILHSKLEARFLHDLSYLRIVNVANPWKKVVFYLKIQSTNAPREQAITSRKIDSGLHLM